MTIKSELITILRDTVKLCAPHLHFSLALNDEDVLIHHRAGNVMLLHSHLSKKEYKQLIKFIETHTVFKTPLEAYHMYGMRDGILKIFEPNIIFVCHVSILVVKHNKFKGLVLQVKNPPVPKCQKEIKRQAETLAVRPNYKINT